MPQDLVIWVVVLWFVLFLILGQHVATVLFASGLLGIALWVGPQVFAGIIGTNVFFTASSYSLSIIPLYLLMAQMLLRGGVIVDLFHVGYRLAGQRRFPLGLATIVSGGLLGAVSGSGAATSAALATLAAPQLSQIGYTRRMSVAIAAVAGSLSAIIPPSLIMIIYGSLTSVSIGHLFIGALLPAGLCIGVYIGCLALFGEVEPGVVDGRTGDAVADDGDVGGGSMPAFVFVVVLMAVVFGGIYGGVVTAGEAGALGAFTALIGMVVMRRVDVPGIALALKDSVRVTAMIMIIVIGSQVFGRFLSYSRLPHELLALVEPLLSQPTLVVALLLGAFFAFGLFLESAAVMVLLIPVMMPILEATEVDLLWFGVMASFMISLGLLTPPVGLAAYAASTAAGQPVGPVFRMTSVFALSAAVVVSAVMLWFPAVVTWLPSTLR
jgi:tripartite ATP-independent transporter DctM subunit